MNAPAQRETQPVRVLMIPPASGGMGRMSRTGMQRPALHLCDLASGAVMADRVQPLVTRAARQRAQGLARRLVAA